MQGRPSATVDLVADITCPWCAVGRRKLEAALATLADEGLHLDWLWRPFLLYPEAPSGGFDQAAHLLRRFGSTAAADRYHEGVVEAGRMVGLEFRYDLIRSTPNTTDAHRLMLFAQETGYQANLADELTRAFFTDGADIGDWDILAGLAGSSGIGANAARAMLNSDQYRTDVAQSDSAAKRAGIRSVPTFCLHRRILSASDGEDLAGDLRAADRALASPG